jgi:hypothetical protein
MFKKGLLTLCGLVAVLGYQFDSAKDPNHPVILPPPQEMTFGNGSALIDPCFFQIYTAVVFQQGADNSTLETIRANVKNYVNRWIFYKGSDCDGA